MMPSTKLFCLPYAGGSARMFVDWSQALPSSIEVVPLELPGRGFRFDEPACDDLPRLVEDLRLLVLPRLDGPFAVFGHSLGAMLGFELLHALARDGEKAVHFFPSGAGAPHIPSRNPAPRFSDDALREHIRELGGTPEELLDNGELMELLMPALRADFLLADTYRPPPGATLSCPTTAFCGGTDDEAPAADVLAWREHVRAPFTVQILPGDHFFVHSARDELLARIASALCPDRTRSARTLTQRGSAQR